MTNTLICWRCNGFFKYDKKDNRPFLYHTCPDGLQAANKNPNNKEKIYIFTPELLSPAEIKIKQKKALNNMLKDFYGN